jgi:hypothetical protein
MEKVTAVKVSKNRWQRFSSKRKVAEKNPKKLIGKSVLKLNSQ